MPELEKLESFNLSSCPPKTDFPGSSAGKESTCNVGDLGSVPGLERSPEQGKGYLLQYSGLENSWTVWSMESQRVGYD